MSEKLNLEEVKDEKIQAESSETPEEADKKHQNRGGKGLMRDESLKLDKEAQKRAVRPN